MNFRVGTGVIAGALFARCVLAQPTPAPAPTLTFEVATIKPAPAMDPAKMMAGKMRFGAKIDAGRAEYNFMSLRELIMSAYKVKPYQITGPDWMTAERWDIQAKLPEGATAEQVPEMLKAFLAERFKLVAHQETKDHPVYALIQGKGGSKMKESEPEPAPPPPPPAVAATAAEGGKPDEKKAAAGGETTMTVNGASMSMKRDSKGGGMIMRGGEMGNMKVSPGQNGMMHFEFQQMKMTRFVDFLSNMVDRPVVDMTDLKGTYEVSLDLSMQEMMTIARRAGMGAQIGPGGGPGGPGGGGPGAGAARPADAASDPGGSSVFTTVEQLGLKLSPRKSPIEQVVIDHLEKAPTEN